MKKFFSFLMVAAMLSFAVACNKGGDAAKTGDAAAPAGTETAVNANPAAPADPNAAPAADPNAVDPNVPKTTMKFDQSEYDFGKVKEGEMVKHVYKFTNTGKEPLIINNAKGSCGCTVPQWPKEPIAPGATGEIQVEFNSKGKPGNQTKTVTITANTDPNPTHLTIKGMVEKDPNAPAETKPEIKVNPSPAPGGH